MLSFLPEFQMKPIVWDRHKHNKLQLAMSQDSPDHFKSKNSVLHPILRDTLYQHNKRGNSKTKNVFETRAIQRQGKSLNIEDLNKLMFKRSHNINLMEERKVNDNQNQESVNELISQNSTNLKNLNQQGEILTTQQVKHQKSNLMEVYDIIGHRDQEFEVGGNKKEPQISQYLQNYNSSYSKDKDVFKRKAGDFENFADFKSQTSSLLKVCDRELRHLQRLNTNKLSPKLDETIKNVIKSVSCTNKQYEEQAMKNQFSVLSRKSSLKKISQKKLSIRLPSIPSQSNQKQQSLYSNQKLENQSQGEVEVQEKKRYQYLSEHTQYDNDVSRDIVNKMIIQVLTDRHILKARTKKVRKSNLQLIQQQELMDQISELDNFKILIKAAPQKKSFMVL